MKEPEDSTQKKKEKNIKEEKRNLEITKNKKIAIEIKTTTLINKNINKKLKKRKLKKILPNKIKKISSEKKKKTNQSKNKFRSLNQFMLKITNKIHPLQNLNREKRSLLRKLNRKMIKKKQ